MKFISGEDYSEEVTRLMSSSGAMKCAVAFWGTHWIRRFEKLSQPLQIICNLESDATNPEIIEAFKRKKNIDLRTHPKLHAKVFLTPEHAIIGSANASANGLSFEDSELSGWIEAGISTDDPAVIRAAEDWFQPLWDDSEDVKKMDDARLQKFVQSWLDRRASRPPGNLLEKSILAKLEKTPEWFKDRRILLVITRGKASYEAKEEFARFAQPTIEGKSSTAGFYENWHDLPAGHYLIDLYYGRRKKFVFMGLFQSPTAPIRSTFRYEKGGEIGEITYCGEVENIHKMTISSKDVDILKTHIEELWEAGHAKGDEGGRYLDLFSAREILFP